MRQQVLKALANPSHIFYVPYSLFVLNFVTQFVLMVVFVAVKLVVFGGLGNPMWFLMIFFSSFCGVHFLLMIFSKRDPQLGQIVSAKLRLLKLGNPRKLAA